MCCLYCVVFYRYTGTSPAPPPGSHYTSPSENMWNTGGTYSMSQGMGVSGTSAHVYITWKHPQQLPIHHHRSHDPVWLSGRCAVEHLTRSLRRSRSCASACVSAKLFMVHSVISPLLFPSASSSATWDATLEDCCGQVFGSDIMSIPFQFNWPALCLMTFVSFVIWSL